MLRYNKAVEYLQSRFCDALQSLDSRFTLEDVESAMSRDGILNTVDKFLLGSTKAPAIFLLVSDQLWGFHSQNQNQGASGGDGLAFSVMAPMSESQSISTATPSPTAANGANPAAAVSPTPPASLADEEARYFELTHLENIMFTPKVSNVTGVAAVIYALRVPNPKSATNAVDVALGGGSSSMIGNSNSYNVAHPGGERSHIIDATTEVLFGVLRENPVEEFLNITRDVLLPLGQQCHHMILTECGGTEASGDSGERGRSPVGSGGVAPIATSETVLPGGDLSKSAATAATTASSLKSNPFHAAALNSKNLRHLLGYSSERSRERTAVAVEGFFRAARVALEHMERLEREKADLASFEVDDPLRLLKKITPTAAGIEKAAKDPAIATFVTSTFTVWINFARERASRDASTGFYVVGNQRRVGSGPSLAPTPPQASLSAAPSGRSSRVSTTSRSVSPAPHPNTPAMGLLESMDGPAHPLTVPDPSAEAVSACELSGITLAPLNPPRHYDFQRLPETYGPLSEVSHWRSYELRAQQLYDSTQSRDVLLLSSILSKCHPALHGVWQQTVSMLRGFSEEAAHVVRYLTAVARHFDPLYGPEPDVAVKAMKSVCDTLVVIHRVVPHYRGREHMQQLVQSVSHQLIFCCKQAIRSLGRVWEQAEHTHQLKRLLRQFAASSTLCRTFQDTLSQTDEFRHLDELCIFGKLELFCSRLSKLTNLFSIVLVFRTLEEHQLGDGLTPILASFFASFEDLRRKSGDSLDYTKPSFDKDYLEFIGKVNDADSSLQVYVNACFEVVPNTIAALDLLKKFSLLIMRPSLRADLQAKYLLLFQRFGTELDAVQRTYEQLKSDPPLPRNATPVAGRVLWARQLHARIEAPMRVFHDSRTMVTHQRDTAKMIRLYNRVAMALTEYEQYWLRVWFKALEVADEGLKATLLILKPTSDPALSADVSVGTSPTSPGGLPSNNNALSKASGGTPSAGSRSAMSTLLQQGDESAARSITLASSYVVNLDATLTTMAREARRLLALGVAVPQTATDLIRVPCAAHATALRHCLREFDTLVKAIQPLHREALSPLVNRVHGVLRPALETITWGSASVSSFLAQLTQSLRVLDEVVKRVNATELNLIVEPIDDVFRMQLFRFRAAPVVPTSPHMNDDGGMGASLPGGGGDRDGPATLLGPTGVDAGMEHAAGTAPAHPSRDTSAVGAGPRGIARGGAGCDTNVIPVMSLSSIVEALASSSSSASNALSTANSVVRDAVVDLCRLIDSTWSPGSCDDDTQASTPFESDDHVHLDALYTQYNRRLLKAVLRATKQNLRQLRALVQGQGLPGVQVLAKMEAVLSPPHLFVSPSLDEVQITVQGAMRAILEASQKSGDWPHVRGAYSTESSASFYDEIHRNKAVVKEILQTSAASLDARRQVEDFLKSFHGFRTLWLQNPAEVVKVFAEQPQRSIEDFQREFQFCISLHLQVQLVPDQVRVAWFEVDCTSLKATLTSLVQRWLERYGAALQSKLDKLLSGLLDRTEAVLKRVAHESEVDVEHLDAELQSIDTVRDVDFEVEEALAIVRQGCSVLDQFHVGSAGELGDRAADIAVKWKRCTMLASNKRDALSRIQLSLRHELHDMVRRFGVEMLCFRNDFEANGPLVAGIKPDDAAEKLRRFQRSLQDRLRTWAMHYQAEVRFGCPPHQYPELAKTAKEVYMAEQLYSLYQTVFARIEVLGKTLWRQVKYDAIHHELQSFQQSIKKLPQSVKCFEAYEVMRSKIDHLLEMHPILEQLGHRAVRERHWQQVMRITSSSWTLEKDAFVLSMVWGVNMLPFKDDIMELALASEKEGELETKLHQVMREWKDRELSFSEYKHRGLLLLKADDTATLKESLEESLVLLGSMLASKYIAPFRHETAAWTTRLTAVGETIALWLEVQATWMYLEAVFSSGDIVKQLPHDAKRFSMVDRQWVKLFFRAVDSPNVLEFSVSNDVKNLPYFKDQLELCQRALAQYLEAKRNAFARFYFVSDSVLLEVLAQGSDPTAMQPHFSAVFDGIHSVLLEQSMDKRAWRVKAMVSAEDETVALSEHVSCDGGIEEWLTRLAAEMCRSVRVVLREVISDVLSIRTDVASLRRFCVSHFSQAVLTALQVLYTTTVTEVLTGSAADRRDLGKRLAETKDVLAEMARGSLTPTMRTHVQTLVTMAVHNLEVWDDFAKKARDPSSFEWLRQLRFYWTDRNECILRIADADILYCNEYLGVKERLVITPLTDRCYITLSQALAMYMGGAPVGPAGTGKTETVKDLGRAAGKYVVVFNCSDQYDARATSKIFRGLAQSGCWGCLDEFNRITLPVLSVVSQQLQLTFHALRHHMREFVFSDGVSCKLLPTMGVFVTMNPSYAGRQELPENLKVHFRSVSMMVPDRLSIMKTKLAAAGYKLDRNLSQKFFLLYALCEQQLSKQQHYDFGLRNILSVLRTAGDVLRSSGSNDEEAVFMRCVRDMNVSKFVHEDVPVFLSLLGDVFPGKTPESVQFPGWDGALRDAADEQKLTVTPMWIRKCTELYETKRVRHGVIVVGPASSGKTSCLRAVLRALGQTEGRQKEVRLNPKAVSAAMLFGRLDASSGDWYDGIFSYLWRRWNKERGTAVWMVCDGPVDTLWIESLNTVLDDNKLLTLANGDRIHMAPTMRLAFEVENLLHASPATVSRAGIVYISLEDIGWGALLQSYVEEQVADRAWPSQARPLVKALIEKQLKGLYQYAIKSLPSFPGFSMQHVLAMFTDLASPLLRQAFAKEQAAASLSLSSPSSTDGPSATVKDTLGLSTVPMHSSASFGFQDSTTVRMIVWYASMWAVGGGLEDEDKNQLSQAVIRGLVPDIDAPTQFLTSATTSRVAGGHRKSSERQDSQLHHTALEVPSLFEHFVDVETGAWVSWRSKIPSWSLRWDPTLPLVNASTIFVPHVMSLALHHVMHAHAQQRRGVLLMGHSGSSKTAVMQEFLKSTATEEEAVVWAKKNVSRATTPLLFQRTVEDMCERRVGSMYGPQRNRRLNLFIDDLGMAEKNEWGDQPMCELLRQLVESGGFYSVDRVGDFKRFVDMKYFGAVTTSAASRNSSAVNGSSPGAAGVGCAAYIPSRLLRHFAVYHCDTPQEASLQWIYRCFLLSRFDGSALLGICDALVAATVHVYRKCHEKLLPTPTRQHYSFNMRDMSRVVSGVLSCPLSALESTQRLATLWNHEMQRCFGDKLCHEDDLQWFRHQLQTAVRDFNIPPPPISHQTIYFANFVDDRVRDPTSGEWLQAPKAYHQTTWDIVVAKLRERMADYNEQRSARTPPLNMVLFEAAVGHVCRLCRILATPMGNALCIGLGGSGRQTIARLASFLQSQPLFQPTVTNDYQLLNWMDDLRAQYFLAATQGPCTLLITDNEIKSEDFLEFINTSLSSGDVPGLFTAEDKEAARNLIRPIARKWSRRTFEDSEEWLWHYFIRRVQEHLHFVICLSPNGEAFHRRVRQFPAIVAACTIDYYFLWSREALTEVAQSTLNESGFVSQLTAAPLVVAELPNVLVDMEAVARRIAADYFALHRVAVGITPSGFLHFLATFQKVYTTKLSCIVNDAHSIHVGLEKLRQAGRDVVAMRKALNSKEVALAAATEELNHLLEELSVKATSATEQKERVQTATDKIAAEAADVARRREEAECDLVAAQPALNAARAALQQITSTDIITLRAMKRPPEMVRRIFDGVCILLHEPMSEVQLSLSNGGRARIEDSWAKSGRIVCSRPQLLDELLQFNVSGKDRLNDETCELLLPYLWQEDFTFERAKSASGNIAGLCTWVRAMEVYRRVAKFVAPKIDALRTAEVLLRAADHRLQLQQAELDVAERAMDACVQEVDKVRHDRELLEEDTLRTKRRLAYASELIDALADEKRRWEAQDANFHATRERLVGDSVVAAALVAFAGPLNPEFRRRFTALASAAVMDRALPFSTTDADKTGKKPTNATASKAGGLFSLISFMVSEDVVSQWGAEGLPMDQQSIENAVIARTTCLVPCFVDPQRQAREWLHRNLESQRPIFTSLQHPKFLNFLEKQMFRGRPLVLEDVSFGCDPLLQSLIAMRPVKALGSNATQGGGGDGGASVLSLGSTRRSPTTQNPPASQFHPTTTPSASQGQGGFMVSLIQQAVAQASSPEYVGYLMGAAYPCDEKFRLFVIPSTGRVDFAPEVFSRVCVLDASVTMLGLEQQMLARTIKMERHELEVEREEVLDQIRHNEEHLHRLEAELLQKLSHATGSLVDDESLILTLQHSKASALAVKEQLEAASAASARIEEARSAYRPVSVRGALLYFTATTIAAISPAYGLSLERMLGIFERSIVTAPSVAAGGIVGGAPTPSSPPASTTAAAGASNGLAGGRDAPSPSQHGGPHSGHHTAVHNAVAQRIQGIIQTLTMQFFALVGRGLFEKHKVIFSFTIAVRVQVEAKVVSDWELQLLLTAGTTVDLEELLKTRPKPFGWLSISAWKHLNALVDAHPVFADAAENLIRYESAFRAFIDADTPELEATPVYTKLTSFQKLLLVRCLREDRTLAAATVYVKDVLGPQFQEVPSYSLDAIVTQELLTIAGGGGAAHSGSTSGLASRTPVLFLLTAGSDPTAHLEQVAHNRKVHLVQLSLGQGQEPTAVSTLHRCAVNGDWALFQNCHLGIPFLQYVARWIDAIAKAGDEPQDTPLEDALLPPSVRMKLRESSGAGGFGSPMARNAALLTGRSGGKSNDPMLEPDHPAFRMFLTCEPVADIPVSLLMRCLPLTNEPPTGTRATMKKIVNLVQQDTYDLFPHPQWKACVQALCCFHGVLLERRKHGIYGWTTPYQFTEGDFVASIYFLQSLFGSMSDSDLKRYPIPWDAVQFMVGDIHYGGRVTIRNDRLTLQAVTEAYFNANLQVPKPFLAPALQRFPVLADIPDVASWRAAVLEQFHVNEPPIFAGLGVNAETAHRTQLVQQALATLLSVLPRRADASSSGPGAEDGADCGPPTASGARGNSVFSAAPQLQPRPGTKGGGSGGRRGFSVAGQGSGSPSVGSVAGGGSAFRPNGGLAREDAAVEMAQQCLKRLPPVWSEMQLLELAEQRDRLRPLTIFFMLEARQLMSAVARTEALLREVITAISGASALTTEIQAYASALALGLVPPTLCQGTWRAQSFPMWISMMLRRYEQTAAYLEKGDRPLYDVACFFNVAGFFNSVRQQICRSRGSGSGWTLGRVDTRLIVTKLMPHDVERPAEEGAFLTGFHLDGAAWDHSKGRLRPPGPKDVYRELPVVLVTATLQATAPASGSAVDAGAGGRARKQAPANATTAGTSLTHAATSTAGGGASTNPPNSVDDAVEQELAAYGNLTQAAFRVHRSQRDDGVTKKVKLPCYTSPLRGDETFVCSVELPHEEVDSAVWVLRGAAVLTMIDL